MRKIEAENDLSFVLLEPGGVRIFRDEFKDVHVLIGETEHVRVKTERPFPLSGPDKMILLVDSEGREIGYLKDVEELEPASKEVLRDEIEWAFPTFRVSRIEDVRSKHGLTTWKIETDRGPKTIHVKDRGDIRALPGGKVIIADMYGLKFLIPSTRQLDPQSQFLLEGEM